MIKIDSNEISRIRLGTQTIKYVYYGTEQVWKDIDLRDKLYILIMTPDGVYDPDVPLFIPEGSTTTLTAHLFRGDKEITSMVEPKGFSWLRESNDSREQDAAWNATHRYIGPSVELADEDVYKRARFSCNFVGEIAI